MTAGSTGSCIGAWDAVEEVVVSNLYMACLDEYLTGAGARDADNVLYNDDKTNLVGFRQSINSVFISSAAKEGVKLLQDIRNIE
mmetsp:Transcript_18041/g.30752  ORF Transcript_18041/g.30752 Transcript_18041/m.30752 type:complete len:84 (+) Transcript_18041:1923-2174(+)